MYTELNDKQREFLEYVKKYHRCVGMDFTIPYVLERNKYSKSDAGLIHRAIHNFEEMKNGDSNLITQYGNPTKYLDK